MAKSMSDVLAHFPLESEPVPYGNGHINDTYITEGKKRFILQRINTNIFSDTTKLMENIEAVCNHVKAKVIAEGGDPDREALTVVRTTSGKLCHTTAEGLVFRVYNFVEGTASYDVPENPEQLYHVGKAFGKFQRQLADFPAETLYETIPDFHNTVKRVENLKAAIENDVAGRAASVKEEIEFALKYERYADLILKEIDKGTIPLRVTHNDTKINNVLLDAETGEGVCVIDLDTVMPGSMLNDFGDALRTGAATAAEDEEDLSKMYFNLDCFYYFAKGFLEETADTLTEKEIEYLPESALILTYECGTRFLADHLNGDTYFKIHKENHNLYRARTQFKLVKDIEEKLPQMREIIKKLLTE